jgi:hypothetical protein
MVSTKRARIALGRRRLALCVLIASGSGAWAQMVVPAGGSYHVPLGHAASMGCLPVTLAGSATIAGSLSQTGDLTIGSGGTLTAAGSLDVGGSLRNAGTFHASTGTVAFVDGCSTTPAVLEGALHFNRLTLSSSTGRSFELAAGASITISGELRLTGTAGNPITIGSQNNTPITIHLAPGASLVQSHATLAPSVTLVPASVAPSPVPIPTLGFVATTCLSVLLAGVAFLLRRRTCVVGP